MFVESSCLDKNNGFSVGLHPPIIILVSRSDFFSDCLTAAMLSKFPHCSFSTIADISELQKKNCANARLILFYQMTKDELQAGLEILIAQPLVPSIGFVVDTIDTLDPSYVRQLIDLQMINGVLPLTLGLEVFMAAVDFIMKGGEHFPFALLNGLNAARSSVANGVSLPPEYNSAIRSPNLHHVSLTIREAQILELIRRGMQNKIIAEKLALSENTVKVLVRNIYKKMNVQNRIQAVSYFDRMAEDAKILISR